MISSPQLLLVVVVLLGYSSCYHAFQQPLVLFPPPPSSSSSSFYNNNNFAARRRRRQSQPPLSSLLSHHSAAAFAALFALRSTSSSGNNEEVLTSSTTTTTTTMTEKKDEKNGAKNDDDNNNKRMVDCYYKDSNRKWRRRFELGEVQIGQELRDCRIVQELLDGTAKTGPKIWCECGVGRYNAVSKKWKIAYGMLRLDRKLSAAKKRAARLKKKRKNGSFTAYVNKVRLATGEYEISLNPPLVPSSSSFETNDNNKLKSLSSLRIGQEVTGTVLRVEDYGCIIAIDNVNHPALLPIQNVAELYGSYINKSEGLTDSGLERNAKLRLQVASYEKRKRMVLDFTDDTKQQAKEQIEAKKKKNKNKNGTLGTSDKGVQKEDSTTTQGVAVATEEEKEVEEVYDDYSDYAAAADYAADYASADDGGDYDEDRDIEDALGLGTY